jgi:hypothetical protein
MKKLQKGTGVNLNTTMYPQKSFDDAVKELEFSTTKLSKVKKLKVTWNSEDDEKFFDIMTKPETLDKSKYIQIGFWRSSDGKNFKDCPTIQEYTDYHWYGKEKENVIKYLSLKHTVDGAYMGYSNCRVCGKINGNEEYTDGKYVWPEGYLHYITEHNVIPPYSFILWCVENYMVVKSKSKNK